MYEGKDRMCGSNDSPFFDESRTGDSIVVYNCEDEHGKYCFVTTIHRDGWRVVQKVNDEE